MRGGLLLLAAALLLAACGDTARRTPSTQPLPEPGPVSEERSRATTADTPKLKESTLRLLASRNLQVQPNRAVHVASQCAHTDDLGTRTRLSLDVNDARVQVFDAEVAIKGRGLCRFALDEFEQVQRMPQVLLRHKSQQDCSVRMWEEGPKVTIAFNSCPRACEGKAFDYLWPIIVETKSGRCY